MTKKQDPEMEKPEPVDSQGRISVLLELRTQAGASGAFAMSMATGFDVPGFEIDHEYEPVPMGTSEASAAMGGASESYILRGTVADEAEMDALRARPEIVEVWRDTPIAPFEKLADPHVSPRTDESMAPCPIPPCDCDFRTAKGTMADVATYLGVNQIWASGFRGTGIVVGIVDGGITAQGRPVKLNQTARRISRVIGGWPSDWGTEASKWGEHGNMTATDVLGMAPEAQLYDFRISGSGGSPGTISRALQAFNWAIDRHKVDGTPHILSNSWGIYQESWDPTYARNANHPFTRKVVEAIDEGILVLFAAGNCGEPCPDGRCGSDSGPGSSIWGANGHPQVMTVAAVNKNEEYIGYSSQGPAALDPQKPDFCGISHFEGYFACDNGTSAATPIVAGVVALMKQAKKSLTQDEAKKCLKATAKDIGPSGFDQYAGAGIIRAKVAFDRCRGFVKTLPWWDIYKRPPRDIIETRPSLDVYKEPWREPITLPQYDIRKWPERDKITVKQFDDVKVPVRDTLEEHVKPPGSDVQWPPRLPWEYQGYETPFALATPHHAPGWEQYESMPPEQGLEQLQAEVQAVAAQLEELYAYWQTLNATLEAQSR